MRRRGAVAGVALALALLAAPAAALACGADAATAAGLLGYWLRALRDGEPGLRALAARALGEARDEAALPALTEALKDANEGVRREARRALDAIRGKR